MDGKNAVLKCVRFRIWPKQHRYQAFASDGNKDELIVEGSLEQLTRHLPQLKGFYSDGCEVNVKLLWPRSSSAVPWFSKSTFRRLLSVVNSAELFTEIKAIEDEMSQLEKARKFHLSLYTQVRGHKHDSESRRAEGDNPYSAASETKSESEIEIVSSDPSKNELLRAIDSRLKALSEELATSLQHAAGSCGSKDISHMVQCCQTLGALELKKYLIKYSEMSQITLTLNYPSCEKPTFVKDVGCDTETRTNRTISKLRQPAVLADQGGLPSSATLAERGNATDEELPSDPSHVDSTERNQTLNRPATLRRSASHMKRVQISRVGSRRATTIGIKSLNNFSAKEEALNQKDEPANKSDEEASEKLPSKLETNVQRISVQEVISLFESKQREDAAATQKTPLEDKSKELKPERRKWSSSVEQYQVQCTEEADTDNNSFTSEENFKETKTQEVDREEQQSADGGTHAHQARNADSTLQTPDILESPALCTHDDTMDTQVEESTERLIASGKGNLQTEAELSTLMKMIEVKPVKHKRPVGCKNNTSELRGGSYNEYSKKRDAREQAAKRSEEPHAMNQIIEKRKVEMSSKDGKLQSLRKSLSPAIPPQPLNTKKESTSGTKPTTSKRGAMKPTSLPATQKSCPSFPPQETSETSETCPVTHSHAAPLFATAKRRKSQPLTLFASPNTNAEKPLRRNNARQIDPKSSLKGASMHRQPWTRDINSSKPKNLASSENISDMNPAKTGLPDNGAIKNSFVPLDSKTPPGRISKVGSAVIPDDNGAIKNSVVPVKSNTSPQFNDSVRRSGDIPSSQEREVAVESPEQVDKHEIIDFIPGHTVPALHSEILVDTDQTIINPKTPNKDNADGLINVSVVGSPFTVEKEVTSISPSAWVEEEENHDFPIMPIPIDDSEIQFAYPPNINTAETATASSCVRRSLSQMLLDEINERENNTEWGNAEHPPNFYPKDAPRGFKKFLKLGRKSKAIANSSGWSSPSVFAEGDGSDDLKALLRRSADNQNMKSTTQLQSLLQEGLDRKDYAGISQGKLNNPHRSTSQIGERHNSLRKSGTKSSRSFFTLASFKGSK